MASRVVMPKLTDTMEEGVLLAWKKREGDLVQAGEGLAEIETDKAIMDSALPAAGPAPASHAASSVETRKRILEYPSELLPAKETL